MTVPKEPAKSNGSTADDEASSKEYDAFEELAKRLLAVPKEKLDAERKAARVIATD